jgi:PAS domain S-box-containing protein/diguanylate cyclase (GGDEF)-like protein
MSGEDFPALQLPSERNTGQPPPGERSVCEHAAGLRRAQEMTGLAHVITDARGEFLTWSDTLPAMIGRDAAAMPRSARAWLKLLHPDDRERCRRTAINADQSNARVELEYRLQRVPGQWLHIRHVMEPLDPAERSVRRWFSTLQDISAAKRAARALQESEERYRTAFEQAAAAIVHTSLEGELRLANQAFCLMTGYSRAEALQLHIRDVTHADDIRPSLEDRARMVAGDAGPYQKELRLRRKDGSHLWAKVTTSLVRSADGAPRHFVSMLSDIAERKRAEEEANRFRAAMDVTIDSIFLSDPQAMRLLYVNDTACQRLGYTREQLLKKPPGELIGRTPEELRRDDQEVMAAGERGMRTEARYVRSDSSEGWTELYRRALSTDAGPVIVTIARDVTERRAQREKIERLTRVYAMLSGINSAIVRVRDRAELFRESCRIAHEAGGFEAVSIRLIDPQRGVAEPVAWCGRAESVQWLQQAQFPLHERGARSLLLEMLQTRRPAISNTVQNDPRVPFRESMVQVGINSAAFLPLALGDKVVGMMSMYSPIRDHFDEPEVKLLSELAADISFSLEHLEKSARADYLAFYDELTGLANRRLLTELLGRLIHAAGQAQGRLAVALLDIERLRSVNKLLGRHAGDALVRQVAERLAQAAGSGATARIASNHFAVILTSVREKPEAERAIVTLLRSCFAAPYVVDETEYRIGVKAGLAMFPTDGLDSETLLVNAEAALRKAKQAGERQVFYTPGLSDRTSAWLPLESKLLGALERDEFVLHYQPKVDTATRRIVGLEALLRWQNPDLGLVPPAKFIPLMEESGMILEVGAWVLQRAAFDQRRWTEQGFAPLPVAVNVSAVQLRHHDFVQAVERAIRGGVRPAGVDLEITESLVMEDVEENVRRLNEVRALGVQMAIDDFGTGYSSLGYLAKLPVHALKIDRSFISAMLSDAPAMTLVQTIISLAHTLGLKVIAEGVEEEEQARYLRLLRCDQFQGYLVSPPVPFDEMTRLLRAGHGARPGRS